MAKARGGRFVLIEKDAGGWSDREIYETDDLAEMVDFLQAKGGNR